MARQVYQNILVINLMHIGDLMLVTPVLRTLRTNYPKAKITLLADKKLRDLVEHNRHIDGCMLLDKKGADDRFGSFLYPKGAGAPFRPRHQPAPQRARLGARGIFRRKAHRRLREAGLFALF